MKVLVSTHETQGDRKNDFCFVPEGEMVLFGALECDGETIDGPCGCRRSMCGISCRKATTTFLVADQPEITENRLLSIIEQNLRDGGWLGLCQSDKDRKEMVEESYDINYCMLKQVQDICEGTILERRGDNFKKRRMSQ